MTQKSIALLLISLIALLALNACQTALIMPDPSPEACVFELPSLSGYELRTKNNGSVQYIFGSSEPPEKWLLATDHHPDAYVYIYEDGGMAIELPADHEIEPLENGRLLLHLPGCRLSKE